MDYIYNTLTVVVPALCCGLADELILVIYDPGDGSTSKGTILERYVFNFSVFSVESSKRNIKQDDQCVMDNESLCTYQIKELEQSLRNVLLRIISLEGTSLGRRKGRRTFTGTSTFKLCLHTVQNVTVINNLESEEPKKSLVHKTAIHLNKIHKENNQNQGAKEDLLEKCIELKAALKDSTWCSSDQGTCEIDQLSLCYKQGHGDPKKQDKESSQMKPVTRPLRSINVPSCGIKMELLMELNV